MRGDSGNIYKDLRVPWTQRRRPAGRPGGLKSGPRAVACGGHTYGTLLATIVGIHTRVFVCQTAPRTTYDDRGSRGQASVPISMCHTHASAAVVYRPTPYGSERCMRAWVHLSMNDATMHGTGGRACSRPLFRR